MSAKYFCECCGKETNITDAYMETKIEISIYSPRKPNIFTHGLSGEETQRFEQCLCDDCKSKIYLEIDSFMQSLRNKYSKSMKKPNYNRGFSLRRN